MAKAEKKSEITVDFQGVWYDDNEVCRFSEGTHVVIKGTITKDANIESKKNPQNVTWTCDLTDVEVEEALTPFGESIRIRMAKGREHDDFMGFINKINGQVIRYEDIDSYLPEAAGRGTLLEQALKKAGFSGDEAKAILSDPTKRAKAQAWYDRLFANNKPELT